jgi:preprotein translocase subunit SecD
MKLKSMFPVIGALALLSALCVTAGCGKKTSDQKTGRSSGKGASKRLDQAGGIRLEYQLDFEEAVENRLTRAGNELVRRISARLSS